MSKTGLVLEGGGMKCAYSAGILDCFLDEKIKFDYVIGVSAGSANAASFIAEQRGRNLRFYTEHINDKDYLGLSSFLRTGNVFGIEYIYSTLTNSDGKDPLDFDKLMQSHTEFEVVTTNAITGEATYFSKESFERNNYREIKASSAIPAACLPVMINGVPYYDGGISDPLPVCRALEKGCDKVVVITSKPRGYIRSPEKMKWFYSLRCKKYPEIIHLLNSHHFSYNEDFQYIFQLEQVGDVFILAPSKPLSISTFTKNADLNKTIYDLGVEDFIYRKSELKNYLSN